MWGYEGWRGGFYPAKARSSDFLSLYSRRLRAVEGNSVFYAVPEREVLARWVAETPTGFQFCLKLPKDFTHGGPLAQSVNPAARFLDHVRLLGDRLGPIFAQLPPTYGPSEIKDLTAFLKAWPRHESELALEVRHRDWFDEPHASRLSSILEELGVGRVLLDPRAVYQGPGDPQAGHPRPKPNVPVRAIKTAPFSVVRFISHPVMDVNLRFLDPWVTCVDRWVRAGVRIYFFVHCPIEERSPENARLFQRMLEQKGVSVPPLPWDTLPEPPGQLSLFAGQK